MKCSQGYEIRPLKSAAGWYLGTTDFDGYPKCRISTQYAPTEEEAKKLFMDRQMAAENEFCNGGCGCIVHFQVNPKFVAAMQGLTPETKSEGYYNPGFEFKKPRIEDEIRHIENLF